MINRLMLAVFVSLSLSSAIAIPVSAKPIPSNKSESYMISCTIRFSVNGTRQDYASFSGSSEDLDSKIDMLYRSHPDWDSITCE